MYVGRGGKNQTQLDLDLSGLQALRSFLLAVGEEVGHCYHPYKEFLCRQPKAPSQNAVGK